MTFFHIFSFHWVSQFPNPGKKKNLEKQFNNVLEIKNTSELHLVKIIVRTLKYAELSQMRVNLLQICVHIHSYLVSDQVIELDDL